MKMWLTKYALTSGIKEVDTEDALLDDPELVCAVDGYTVYTVGKDMFKTKAKALVRAEGMRIRKISSLHRQLAKMEDLTFE